MGRPPLLEIDRLTTGYGRIEVVHEVSATIPSGVAVALLGPSGAGKTTLLRCLSGLLPAIRGRVCLHGERIDGLAPSAIAERGMVHVPERGAIFGSLTVRENLRLGLFADGARTLDDALPAVLDAFPPLGGLLDREAGTLSGGERQMVALGRAFITGADVLLLDELSMGLAPEIVGRLYKPLGDLRDAGHTVVIVEQSLERVLDLADLCLVMVSGRLVTVAEPAELRGDRAATAYLGM